MKESSVHRATGQLPVRSGIVERQDRFGAMGGDRLAESLVHEIERLVPTDALVLATASRPDPTHRMAQPFVTVDEIGIVARHLVADDTGRVGVGIRAAHRDNLLIGHFHRQAAGIGAVQRADGRPDHGIQSRLHLGLRGDGAL